MVLLSQIFLIIFNKKSSIQPQIFQSPAPNQLNKSPEITNQSAKDKKMVTVQRVMRKGEVSLRAYIKRVFLCESEKKDVHVLKRVSFFEYCFHWRVGAERRVLFFYFIYFFSSLFWKEFPSLGSMAAQLKVI